MLLSKTVPSVKTVSMKVVCNAKPTKHLKDKPVWSHGVHAIMHTTLTVSADGQVKRKILAPYAKKPGPQSKQQNNERIQLIK